MSRIIATAAIRGAHKLVARAEEELGRALKERGEKHSLEFKDTAFYLPLIYALTGIKIKTLGDAVTALEHAKTLLPPIPSEKLWLPYLGDALDAGIATLIAEEIMEAVKYLDPAFPGGIWLGFTSDATLREQGIKLVDGRMPGFAACVGAMPNNEAAVKIIRELQERNILIFLSAQTDGRSLAEQLAEKGVEMSWDTYLVPYGKDITATVHALNFAARAAMTFGGITPGGIKEAREILLYNKNRVHAFVLALGEVDDEKYATAAGAINFGFPTIADTEIPQILPSGICTYEHVVSRISHEKIVSKAIEVRGLKVKVTKLPIPVPFGPAFEGERVRKEQMAVEIGGKVSRSFEYLRGKALEEVEDNKIMVVGPEIDIIPEGGPVPMGIVVEVAGRKMRPEFESILERRIHTFVSEIMGVMHIGQRDMNWIRISHDAKKAGLKFHHLGVVIRAQLLNEFPAIVDKVQVTIYTQEEDILRFLPQAQKAYQERDARVAQMTDESVDIFYSCTLCQSYAPNHVCIITPERLGLCGAYNWLDGRAAYEINPAGPNQPVLKGECFNPEKGEFRRINEFVRLKSNGTVERVYLYSMMEYPMTSCGCFECIMSVVPEVNGVMIVNRGSTVMTPVGMTFSTLAGSVGGGNQTPGFLGVGRLYLTSRKFIVGDGGFRRIVWMTKELKDAVLERLKARAQEIGEPDFVDKIADETIATTAEELLAFAEKVGHPALTMPPLF